MTPSTTSTSISYHFKINLNDPDATTMIIDPFKHLEDTDEDIYTPDDGEDIR